MSIPVLHMINLDQKLVGHQKFLSCWVSCSQEMSFLVDPGPPTSAAHLIDELKALAITRLDYILLTHVHIDHAAGAAHVLEAFPDARILCHEQGIEHMIDPTRLWQSSLSVLRPVAEAYGPPPPVPASSIATLSEIEGAGIEVIPTPGHAAHHLSFLHEGTLYVGEAVGLRVPIPGHIYLRPATPRRFVLEVALDSIDRLLALQPAPERMAFPHFGMVDDPVEYMKISRKQMPHWVEIVRELLRESADDLVGRAHERLLDADPYYATVTLLDPDIQQRERLYLEQTLEGLVEYVRST
ncbi:MAG: MBL fold metallo-hydrolase [Candidatus Eisenbacteria sp.]|nr:MBL fold metallo-hydrolase [Candidatus Eisenbacteria bacterium]